MPVVKDVLKAKILELNAQSLEHPMSSEEYAETLASAVSEQILSLTIVVTAPPTGGSCTVIIK